MAGCRITMQGLLAVIHAHHLVAIRLRDQRARQGAYLPRPLGASRQLVSLTIGATPVDHYGSITDRGRE
jgi:hypothetical protein